TTGWAWWSLKEPRWAKARGRCFSTWSRKRMSGTTCWFTSGSRPSAFRKRKPCGLASRRPSRNPIEMEAPVIPEELLEMAQTYRMLSELDPQQLRKLVPLAEHKQYYTGQIIFHIGDQS